MAVVMLKCKWWRVGNGSVISVDWRDSDCRRRNCRMLYFKLTISQVRAIVIGGSWNGSWQEAYGGGSS